MRITIDIPDDVVLELARTAALGAQRQAVVQALSDRARELLRAELDAMFGNFDYGMTNDELEAIFDPEPLPAKSI